MNLRTLVSGKLHKIYFLFAILTLPWAIYTAKTLPSRHVVRHWDILWLGIDLAIVALLAMNAWLIHVKSKYVSLTLTATATLLLVDAWFDIMSARHGKPLLVAIAMAVLIEIPLAVISMRVAAKKL